MSCIVCGANDRLCLGKRGGMTITLCLDHAMDCEGCDLAVCTFLVPVSAGRPL